MKGLDLSEHNGNVNFKKVKNNGYDFVILRLGWVGNKENHTLDKKFYKYYKDAKKVGLKVGVYVYNYCKTVAKVQEAMTFVLGKLLGLELEFPIFIDMEDKTIIESGAVELTAIAKYFCDLLEVNGYKAGVYANKNWFTKYLDIRKLEDYKIWLAEWNDRDTHTAKFKVDLWQFSNKGIVTGIKGNVDLNMCLACKIEDEEPITGKKEEFELAKKYKNGSTKENVYADLNCSKKIGTLNKYEECECLDYYKNKYIIRYKLDNKNNYKVGFVKYSGGVKA